MIYLDSCILIYALEDSGPRGDAVRRALAAVDSPVASSPLALQECLVGPLRDRNVEVRDRYLALFDRIEIVDLDVAVFVRAAELRADFRLKTPDAVHLAAAQLSECTELWTNDKRLATASRGLAVDVIG
ncbi:putative nucleic acid-binding protein [Microbacterium phyllosphaerae]|uniref:Ribonuclease VapC n=1 Tax=Microbacterium phyllosphaerae TaxID=124798 RepID=A0ABS4WUH4_9MICO|nr:type II toxin-antitoxin system VapC family toxin [Microbacterium phyllosphaerae]MBP2379801.1 putative nucleic acid-binding protein [Microbacterium phyllosphaerae]MCS3444039.1 putative nucleic acid-binding protein [Microbacterium phyllosphaerae]